MARTKKELGGKIFRASAHGHASVGELRNERTRPKAAKNMHRKNN